MDKSVKPVIGKYVIENLTVGMYDDPLCIYREYIQNSADAIDQAVSIGLVEKKDASIFIHIDTALKSITITDNGIGVSQNQVVSVLQNVAESDKEIGRERGFRGIGRLGGLAYCETLVFETSSREEATKSVMTWNAKELKRTVSDRSQKEDAADVISRIVQFKTAGEDIDAHYFRITMSGVSSAVLLDTTAVKDYLTMVAPLPFDSNFSFRKRIQEELSKNRLVVDDYTVFLNHEQLYKAYTNYFYVESSGKRVKAGEIQDIQFFKGVNEHDEVLYWGWHSVSDTQNNQLKPINQARGLRLRKSNIQIGNERRLANLFKDPRFNMYVVGEVHTWHKDLIPNGRRDDFEDTVAIAELREKLKPVCNNIQAVSYKASELKNAQKAIDDLQTLRETVAEKQQNGFTNKEEVRQTEELIERKQQKAQQAERVINKFRETVNASEPSPSKHVLGGIIKPNLPSVEEMVMPFISKSPLRTDKLSLKKDQRKLMQRVFNVIYNALPKELAETVILKIEEEFK
ncbi:ATP-binding protein [Fibrella sp. HMF5335]|uniref:ATP-binding protein n=1 Tax=Fibrella rubiginis TaxID=2817060 RepID=A0A939GER6_9BACT|nr:ATP-binding protein [Fibrella rubiginis]MBO0937639.1 ATP-binding protein [Fibrella rubiginis]